MFDECRGDKFEEVIAAFALTVFRKHASENAQLSLAEPSDREMLVLIIAYRKKLQCPLERRKEFNRSAQDFARSLRDRKEVLRLRRSELPQSSSSVDLEETSVQKLESVVRGSWVGDERWIDVLLFGHSKGQPPVLQDSFEEEWENFKQNGQEAGCRTHSVLEDVNARVTAQVERYRKWKAFHDHFELAQKAGGQRRKSGNTTQTDSVALTIFNQHEELHLGSHDPEFLEGSGLLPADDESLRSMQRELGSLSSKIETQSQLQEHTRQNMDTPPLATADDRAAAEEFPLPSTSGPVHWLESPQNLLEGPLNIGKQNIDLTLDNTAETQDLAEDENATTSDFPGHEPEDSREQPVSHGSESFSAHETRIREMNLSERTRMSMAAVHLNSAISSSPPNPVPSSPPPGFDLPNSLQERTRDSLSILPTPDPQPQVRSQRSRKPAPRSKHTKRPSQYFPAKDPFPANLPETSDKPDLLMPPEEPRLTYSGSSTPRERLFSDEAEYSSVFKSRPRIALSPAFGPERDNALGLDSLLQEGMDHLTLEQNLSDIDTPSRLRR